MSISGGNESGGSSLGSGGTICFTPVGIPQKDTSIPVRTPQETCRHPTGTYRDVKTPEKSLMEIEEFIHRGGSYGSKRVPGQPNNIAASKTDTALLHTSEIDRLQSGQGVSLRLNQPAVLRLLSPLT